MEPESNCTCRLKNPSLYIDVIGTTDTAFDVMLEISIDDYWNVNGERELSDIEMSDASKRKEKQKWAIENPRLDNARRLLGIYFIDPEDEEFCKEFSSYYRKLATKTVRIQHEQQHEH